MMRRIVLRPAAAALVAALLSGTAAGPPARAGEGLSRPPKATMRTASAARTPGDLIQRGVGVPALPPARIRMTDRDDVVGSIRATLPKPLVTEAAVPPALTYEDSASAAVPAALLTGVPGANDPAPAPATVAPVPDPQPAPRGPAAEPGEVSPAAATPASPAASPDAAALTAALGAFVAEAVPGDTAAQAADRRAMREAITATYAAHDNAPFWTPDGHFSAAARSAQARLDHASEDALDIRRFPVPVPAGSDPVALARADLALSEAVVAYGRQAGGSRVDVAHLGGIIDFRPDVAEPARILETVSQAADAGEALQAFNPPQPGYAALRDKLAELRHSDQLEGQSHIPAGQVLKPGMKDARVPLIRARFGLDVTRDEPGVPPLVYDTQVAAAVADFQRAHGLPGSGLLTSRTVAALSGGNPARLESDIVANMELWRWMPRAMAPDRVEVNIPDYTARVLRDGATVHETRVVVGEPDKPTPVFAQEMRFIIVNPYWNVPLSIIKNEMLPKLAANPNYFADHGYEVVEREGVRYVRQPPGDGNALGRIKFMFPNSHSVYLHDTNARSYFAREMRALSHGCVRVDQPFAFAEAVLGRDNGWTEARVRKMIGGEERTVMLPKPLPILITYFTAFVDPKAGFQLRDDIYGYTGKVKVALDLQN